MCEKVVLAYQPTKGKPISPILKKITHNYSIYQIIPDRFIPDGKVVEEILISLSALKSFPVTIKDKCIYYDKFLPTYYEIFYDGKKVSFNYSIPEQYDKTLVSKLRSIYKSATILQREDYYNQFAEKDYCLFKQKRHFMFSLNVDYRENGLIEGLLSLVNNIQDDDKVLVQIGILPLDDNWKRQWKLAYAKYKKGEEIKISNSIPAMIIDNGAKIIEDVLTVADMFMGEKTVKKNTDDIDLGIGMHSIALGRGKFMTMQKINYTGFQIQIKMFTEDDLKCKYYSKILDGIFKVLDADQELVPVNSMFGSKKNKYSERHFDFQTNKNIFSMKELAIFMQMPNRRMQLDFKKTMQSVDTRESNIPKELKNGNILIGTTKYHGESVKVYWDNNSNVLALPKIVIGAMGGGKSKYVQNFIRQAHNKCDGIIVFDYIDTCQLTNELNIPDAIKINLAEDFSKVALAYPEVIIDETNIWKRIEAANIISEQVNFLISSLIKNNVDDMSVIMENYLDAACKIVFIHKGSRLRDVINVLTDFQVRNEYIGKAIDCGCFSLTDSEIKRMKEINEVDKSGMVIGTKDIKIDAILNRISLLDRNIYLRAMTKAEINYDYNFTKWMDEGKTVYIQIPESIFPTKQIKDTIVTYFMSRVWLATLMRKNKTKVCHVITDEIHQIPTCSKLMSNIVTEGRKFGVGFFFTIHYFKQFRSLYESAKSAGTSYMLLAGAEKENFELLKEELLPYDIEDVLDLKPFTSLNLINYGNQWCKFISELPPIK